MQNIITFTQLENYAKSLELTDPKEQWMRDEILAFIEMKKEYFETEDQWETPAELIENIIDEAHDGAYDESETDKPFDDNEFEAFCIEYGILPEDWNSTQWMDMKPYLGSDNRYSKESAPDYEKNYEYIHTSWMRVEQHFCGITLKTHEEILREQESYVQRLKRLHGIFKDLIQWSRFDKSYYHGYLHNHYQHDPQNLEELWKRTSIHPSFKPEY